MTNLTEHQKVVFESLFRDKYNDWPGDLVSLIKFCHKETQKLSPKSDIALKNAEI